MSYYKWKSFTASFTEQVFTTKKLNPYEDKVVQHVINTVKFIKVGLLKYNRIF